MKLVSVVRVSSSGQDTEGQKPANQRWADSNGHTIARTVEIKASAFKMGTDDKPTSLERKLDEILATRPEGIVMRRADRLSRQGIERGLRAVRLIRIGGVALFFADFGAADVTQMDDLHLSVYFHTARSESLAKSDRTFDNHMVIRDNQAWTGIPAFGYRVDHEAGRLNARLALCEPEAKIVREMFERCANGASLRELAQWVTSQAPARRGKTWDTTQVRKMLRHKAYATGEAELSTTPWRHIGSNPVQRISWIHEHEAIVDSELFSRANAALDGRRNRSSYTRDDTLQGLEGAITCSKCGGKLYLAMQVKNGRDYERYQCRKGHGMPRVKAEALVAEMMHGHIQVKSTDTTVTGADARTGELHSLRKELARANPSTDEGFQQIVELRQKIAELSSAEATEPENQGLNLIWLNVSMYETSDWPERRELVRKAGIKL